MKLAIRVKANSHNDKIVGWENNELVIELRAQALEGKANKALVDFLAKKFKSPKRDISIIRGDSSPHKLISIPDGIEISSL